MTESLYPKHGSAPIAALVSVLTCGHCGGNNPGCGESISIYGPSGKLTLSTCVNVSEFAPVIFRHESVIRVGR